jgi:hypothetical protein
MDIGSVGKVLVVAAVVLGIVGLLFLAGSALGIGHLPGDLSFGGKHAKVFVPIGTSIVLSIVATVVLNLLFRGK